MIAIVGNGPGWRELLEQSPVWGVEGVVADTAPSPARQGTATVYLRGSCITLPPEYNRTADWLKAPNCRRAYDEVVFPISDTELEWWRAVLPAIGVNDGGGEPSEVVLFVAGDADHSNADAWVRAAAANPRVRVAVEGYHQGALYRRVDDLRANERAWFARIQLSGVMARTWLGISASHAPWHATINPAYCSYSALAAVADEKACAEWLQAGCRDLFVWVAYSSEASRAAAADALQRALRSVWPDGVRDAAG